MRKYHASIWSSGRRSDSPADCNNGDVGFVTGIDAEEGELEIAFDDRPVVYSFSDLDRVVLAYATTIHKAQGSEYPAVVILVGDKRAVAIAVKGTTGRRRWSKLQEWLAPNTTPARDQKRVAKEDGIADHTR